MRIFWLVVTVSVFADARRGLGTMGSSSKSTSADTMGMVGKTEAPQTTIGIPTFAPSSSNVPSLSPTQFPTIDPTGVPSDSIDLASLHPTSSTSAPSSDDTSFTPSPSPIDFTSPTTIGAFTPASFLIPSTSDSPTTFGSSDIPSLSINPTSLPSSTPTEQPTTATPTTPAPSTNIPSAAELDDIAPRLCSNDPFRYNICLDIAPGASLGVMETFATASARWSQVITGDLPSDSIPSDPEHIETIQTLCGYSPSFASDVIDDLNVCVNIGTIDGVGGVLGFAGPFLSRDDGGKQPSYGLMKLDVLDVESLLESGLLEDTVLHELGHVIGIGTRWAAMGLTPSNDAATCNSYSGPSVRRAYREISGCNTSPPVEDDTQSEGTDCGHWDETCFGNELMTGVIRGVPNPLSTLTIAALDDLGYTVDYSVADTYPQVGSMGASCLCNRRLGGDTGALEGTHSFDKSPKRKLSPGGLQIAEAYGMAQLDVVDDGSHLAPDIHIPSIMVYYMEDGAIHDVRVSREA